MTSEKPADLVLAFFTALAQHRIDDALEKVDDDILYTNVSLPSVRGKRRFATVMRALNGDRISFDATMLAICADENGVVLTERLDELRIGPLRMQFWVCGRSEVREGRITVWRDYFDFWNCARGFFRGLAAMVIPPLRRTLPGSLSSAPVASPAA